MSHDLSPAPLPPPDHDAVEWTLKAAVGEAAAALFFLMPLLDQMLVRWGDLEHSMRAGELTSTAFEDQRRSLLSWGAWQIITALVANPLPYGGGLRLCPAPASPESQQDQDKAHEETPSPVYGQGEATQKALLRFVQEHRNHCTAADYPEDEQRWFAFVIAAHQDIYPLSGADLAMWLIQVHNWFPDIGQELGRRYEKERSLLSTYDEVREGG